MGKGKKRVMPVYLSHVEAPAKIQRLEPLFPENVMTFADGSLAMLPNCQIMPLHVPQVEPVRNVMLLPAPVDAEIVNLVQTSVTGDPVPTDFASLTKSLNIKSQHSCGQLDFLLGSNWKQPGCSCPYCMDSPFSIIKLPNSNKQFQQMTWKKRKYLVPNFVSLNGVNYEFDLSKKVKFGGYGAVAFYNRAGGAFLQDFAQPERIVLKVGSVKKSELEPLFGSNFNAAKSKSHWIREFCIYRRLKLAHKSLNGSFEADKGFVNFLGGCVAKIGRSFYAFNALEAGKCDLFELFTSQQMSKCIPMKQMALVKVMQSAASSLQQLHNLELHHGDVKLANILLNSSQQKALFMDFDGAVFFDEKTSCDTYTREYVSPQRRDQCDCYSKEADDNWALGISFLIALTLKKSPLEGMKARAVERFGVRSYLRSFLSGIVMPPNLKLVLENVICGLLEPTEELRMTAGEAATQLGSALISLPPWS